MPDRADSKNVRGDRRKAAAIICPTFLNQDGTGRLIGGIQTYVFYLSQLLVDMEFDVVIVQGAKREFEVQLDSFVQVKGIEVSDRCHGTRLARRLVDRRSLADSLPIDVLIFASEQSSCLVRDISTVLIQHGVSWDIDVALLPQQGLLRRLSVSSSFLENLRKQFQQWRYRALFHNAKIRVCVDYNFPNWLRAVGSARESSRDIVVIPNAVFHRGEPGDARELPSEYTSRETRVIFARRFERYRGCIVMARAAKRVLSTGEAIVFTFAGEGEGEKEMRNLLQGYEQRISFVKYSPENAVDIHRQHDIAVIPSIASEGTSLAVLEAMAAGCAVIACPTGGITNIVVDQFNGLYVDRGSDEQLAAAILQLHRNSTLRKRLSRNGLSVTSGSCFSYESWCQRWREVIGRAIGQ